MSTQLSRMQFLRGDFRGKDRPIRPPWALAETLFTEICTGCGDCITQCPEGIIKAGRAGYPVVEFSTGECTFCEACVETCDANALLKNSNEPWQIKASIETDKCIAYQGVECRSCYDPCEPRAVSMHPRPGGISIPRVETENCSGCGACIAVCPVAAINMQAQTTNLSDNEV